MGIDPEGAYMAKRFEPILLFHKDERFFPLDPKFYLERCALWRSEPPSDRKQDWGELPHTTYPRRPQLEKGKIAALQDEATVGKTWLGETDGGGNSPYLVIPEPEGERPLPEDRFLQLTGWEPLAGPPNEVTANSNNRHPTLDKTFYDGALQGGRAWYYAEYLTNQQLMTLTAHLTPNGMVDLWRLVTNARLSAPRMLVYHFFYALHEEPLRGCEQAGEGQTFATFAGEWSAVAILLNSASKPLYIGVTSRNVGDPSSIPGQENRLGLTVYPWKKVETVGEHPKICVSRGTHGNYLSPGAHDLKPFTPGDIDLNQGTCAQIEKLDDVIPGGEAYSTEGEDADIAIILLKAIPTVFIGMFWAAAEGAFGSFGASFPAMEPDRKPQDETGGPNFGLILRPAGLFVPEQSAAARLEDWPTTMPEATDKPRYDFIVDRETQVWWPPQGRNRGYAGRWGVQVTNDPKRRRAGMRCPNFWLMFLEGIARLAP